MPRSIPLIAPDFIAKHEGCSSVVKGKNVYYTDHSKYKEDTLIYPYLDVTAHPTIGFGNTTYLNGTKVTILDNPITYKEAKELYKTILKKYATYLDSNLTIELNDNQYTALLSLTYNSWSGVINVTKLINTDINHPDLKSAFTKVSYSGGKFIQSLYNRRIDEYNLFITPVERPKAFNIDVVMSKIKEILVSEIEIKLW